MGQATVRAALLLFVFVAAFGLPAGAQIPPTWKGEVEIDSEIPTVSLSGAITMVKTGGTVPITADNGTIQGKASIPYVNDVDAPNCTMRVRGQFDTTINGTYVVPTQDDMGTFTGGTLDLQFTRALTNATNTISCPPRAPIVVPMTIPAAGGKTTQPFKHKAGSTQTVNLPGGATLHSTLAVSLPCDWDDGPPGPKLVFTPADPREPTFASGIPDETRTIKQLTDLDRLANPDEQRTDAAHDLGMVTFSLNFMPHLHTSSAPARSNPGKSCVWVDSIEFTVRLINVYVASDLSQGPPMCRDLVLAHEDRHFRDVQSLLRQYTNEIARQMKSVPGPSWPGVYDDPTDGEARVALMATSKLDAIEADYTKKAQQAGAVVDDDPIHKEAVKDACGRLLP